MFLGKRLKIRLHKNFDGFFACVNFNANRIVAKIYLVSATVLSAYNGVRHFPPQLIPTRSRNQRPKRTLAPMLGFEADRVTIMRLEAAEITDGFREASALCKVPGGVPVSFHSVLFQGKIDH
jgi:hypothetical protein